MSASNQILSYPWGWSLEITAICSFFKSRKHNFAPSIIPLDCNCIDARIKNYDFNSKPLDTKSWACVYMHVYLLEYTGSICTTGQMPSNRLDSQSMNTRMCRCSCYTCARNTFHLYFISIQEKCMQSSHPFSSLLLLRTENWAKSKHRWRT